MEVEGVALADPQRPQQVRLDQASVAASTLRGVEHAVEQAECRASVTLRDEQPGEGTVDVAVYTQVAPDDGDSERIGGGAGAGEVRPRAAVRPDPTELGLAGSLSKAAIRGASASRTASPRAAAASRILFSAACGASMLSGTRPSAPRDCCPPGCWPFFSTSRFGHTAAWAWYSLGGFYC